MVCDYFTEGTESYSISNQEVATAAEKLVSGFICYFGVPCQLHSHQGANFESKMFVEVWTLIDIEKTLTTPPHLD